MFFFFTRPSFFSLQRPIDIALRSLLSFLYEAVQQHHASLFYTEENPGNPAPRQTTPHFPQFAAQRTNERHADRP
jgi:hypothetical protein